MERDPLFSRSLSLRPRSVAVGGGGGGKLFCVLQGGRDSLTRHTSYSTLYSTTADCSIFVRDRKGERKTWGFSSFFMEAPEIGAEERRVGWEDGSLGHKSMQAGVGGWRGKGMEKKERREDIKAMGREKAKEDK